MLLFQVRGGVEGPTQPTRGLRRNTAKQGGQGGASRDVHGEKRGHRVVCRETLWDPSHGYHAVEQGCQPDQHQGQRRVAAHPASRVIYVT